MTSRRDYFLVSSHKAKQKLEPMNPYQYALTCLGGKWKMTILHEIAHKGSIRFNSARKAINISEKVFSQTITDLMECGLVERHVNAESMPPVVFYTLTPSGMELIPIIDSIYIWSVRAMNRAGVPLDPDALVVHNEEKYIEALQDIIPRDTYQSCTIRVTERKKS